ncbi:MAG TPA: PEP/pyruvate-binding domain-containing protein [Anaeromyxobacter sp.]
MTSSEDRAGFQQLLRTMITRDDRVAELAARWLDLPDLLAIRRRMIGTGLVGGKAAGMLLAHAILGRQIPRLSERLEPHDSWFVGSDVFHTYLVRKTFPDFVLRQFAAMLEYYGPSPIIVRSSSLLEDGFGNAFSGKYDSFFCANQGSPADRLEAFLAAVRAVYASVMSEKALRYREHRGLLGRDERMAILVQRVSGAVHGSLFFPQAAGVALSYNPWAWNREIDPHAGLARLVFGLGTRAVDRANDDYARLVALDAPAHRPEATQDEARAHAQRRVDVLDLEANRFASLPLEEVIRRAPGLSLDLFATARPGRSPLLTFDRLLSATPFVDDLREILRTLSDAYGFPVDVEFTLNDLDGGRLRLNVVQCRPLQVKEGGTIVAPPDDLPPEAVLLESRGPVIGQSTHAPVDRVVLVDPDAYERLGTQDRHEVARVVGRVTRLEPPGARRILLLGPGRWGTTTVALGVPVVFAEIERVSALCEIVRSRMNVVPDPSLGSHFFNDLVEANVLYVAVTPDRPGYRLAEDAIRAEPNRLAELLPDDARLADVVRVVDFPRRGDARSLWLNASCLDQRVLCFLAPATAHSRAAPGES